LDTFFGRDQESEYNNSKVDIFDIAAHVPRSDSPKRDSQKPHPQKKSHPQSSKRAGGNVTFEQGNYVVKDKSIVTKSDFFDVARKNNQKSAQTSKSHMHTSQDSSQGRPIQQPMASKVQKEATTSANLVKKSELFMDDTIIVKEFSEKM
jgi:hypothetical protein